MLSRGWLYRRLRESTAFGDIEDGGDFKQEFPWHLGQKTFFKINVKLERDSEWRSLAKLDYEREGMRVVITVQDPEKVLLGFG